jgi:hypothetical protein
MASIFKLFNKLSNNAKDLRGSIAAHGRHFAEHGNEALLVHPLEQLQSLEG